MIDDALRTILAAHSGTNALIGSGSTTRIYPMLAPEEATYPCVVYERISTFPRRHLTANSGLATARYQFGCWADSAKEARELAEQARQALDNYTGSSTGTTITLIAHDNTSEDVFDSPDQEEKRVFVVFLVFMVTYQETIP